MLNAIAADRTSETIFFGFMKTLLSFSHNRPSEFVRLY